MADKYVALGTLGKPFGIKGLIKIHADTNDPESFVRYQSWFVQEQGVWRSIQLNHIHHQYDRLFLGQIKGITSPEDAKVYSGKAIAVKREELPPLPKNQYYWSDLVGMTVKNIHQVVLGTVDHLLESGKNVILVVKERDSNHLAIKTRLLPFALNNIIRDIDLKKNVMTVDWEEDF